MKVAIRSKMAAALLGLLWAAGANAGVQVLGTRFIYNEGQPEIMIKLNNGDDAPRLVQAWVDDGDATATAKDSKAPFVVNPPMARMDPSKGQTLRLMFTGGQVPADRESVYYLNVLEVPPRPKVGEGEEQTNYVQFAVRTRLKIFYRPKGLSGEPAAAFRDLQWRVVKQEGDNVVVECRNPTVFNVSFNKVAIKGAKPSETFGGGGMCPAKGTQNFTIAQGTAKEMDLSVINDYGGFEAKSAPLAQ